MYKYTIGNSIQILTCKNIFFTSPFYDLQKHTKFPIV